MRRTYVFALFFLLLAAIQPAMFADEGEIDHGGEDWAVNAKIGTLGIGAELNRSIIPRLLNLRVGASFFSYSTDFDEEGINYDAKLKLGAIPIAIDVFPFKNWFRLGGGMVINLNEVNGTGRSTSGTFSIGDHEYTSQEIGQVKAKSKFNRVAPYFGLGFNNPIKRFGHLGFFADLGFLYHGTPSISMSTTKSVPQLQTDIDKEIQSINEDLKDYKLFPVIQLGISYRF